MRVGIYARVSMADQNCEMQIRELREYLSRRGWEVVEMPKPLGWTEHEFKPKPLDRDGRERPGSGTHMPVSWYARG